jgi:hypothetical protein
VPVGATVSIVARALFAACADPYTGLMRARARGGECYWLAAMLVGAMLILGAACASPSGPSTADVSGRWGGLQCPQNRRDAVCGVVFWLTQTGTSVSGTWGTTYSHGTLTGELHGAVLTLTMTLDFPANAPCPSLVLTATVSGNQMTGVEASTCGDSSATTPLSATRE